MAQAIEAELGDLQMKQARFAVQITWKADDRGAIVDSDNVSITVNLINPIAMEEGLRFAIREGGRTVGAGVVAKIIE